MITFFLGVGKYLKGIQLAVMNCGHTKNRGMGAYQVSPQSGFLAVVGATGVPENSFEQAKAYSTGTGIDFQP